MAKNICIFCKSSDGPFKSREHIVPESLGNTTAILEPGIVCDLCNNGPLAVVDKYLLEQEYIDFMRVWLNIPNKSGIVPEARTSNGIRVKRAGAGVHVTIPNYKKKHSEQFPPAADGTVSFKLNMKGRRLTDQVKKQLARSLYKIGLEFIAFNESTEAALDSQFDEVREIVLNPKKDFHGYIVTRRTETSAQCQLRYTTLHNDEGGQLKAFSFDFYGQSFLFDMTQRQVIESKIPELKAAGFSVLIW